MKRIRLITLLLLLLTFSLSFFALSACQHVHNYNQKVIETTYKESRATCGKKATYFYSCKCGEKGTKTFEYGNVDDTHYFDKEVADDKYIKSEATCTEKAVYNKSCSCGGKGVKTFEYGEPLGHVASSEIKYDGYSHWVICLREDCGEKINVEEHNIVDTYCTVCGSEEYTQELTYILNNDGNSYAISGISDNTVSKIKIPLTYNDLPITEIKQDAFSGNTAITSVDVGGNVTSIGSHAFYNCTNLASFVIPDIVTSLGLGIFEGCSNLAELTIPFIGAAKNGTENYHFGYIFGASESSYNYSYVPQSLNSLVVTNANEIADRAFYGCRNIDSIEISGNITSIGESAFEMCQELKNIKYPDSVTSIERRAFYYCESLTSVKIPDDVASIGESAFGYCESLTSVKIPDGVTSIGENAFGHCKSLTSVKIPDGVTSIESYTFYDCENLMSVEIGRGVTNIEYDAFISCRKLVEVINHSAYITLDEYSYDYGDLCSYALDIYNSDDVFTQSNLSIDNGYAIYTQGQEKILVGYIGSDTALSLPSYITKINQYAFYDCNVITVVIPESVKIIDGDAFYNCRSLLLVDIEGAIVIKSTAFWACENLTIVIISSSLTTIDTNAFNRCESLTTVYYKGTAQEWGNTTIRTGNDPILAATIYYYSETEPTQEGNYWHYDTDGVTPVIWEN